MDNSDIYTYRRLLYKCDNSIAKIYGNIMKLADPAISSDQSLKAETMKEIDVVIFQIFKYKTALLSLQKDLHANQESQIKADEQINRSKEQIKILTQQVKSAQAVRRRKLQFNQIAKSVKQFDTNEELNNKIKQVQTEVQKLQAQYRMEMEAYAEKQRNLRIALSALRVLMKQDGSIGIGQSPLYPY